MKASEYREMLEKHDWYWRMSDSPNVRNKGEEEEKKIKELANTSLAFANLYANIMNRKITT